ncbi:uncharacterized protein LOC126379576 [Pectinophora gossypiella]|uniref:uncharacterized protein LOC126379576 n=1 Tax=Pectinophora gossypiella TaxID=13191 RepID=UPI00214EFC1D|nr:uncharacterized protein LOC126379576 [Pectinophora gossypiella]
MSDKTKSFAAPPPKTSKTKRPTTVSVSASSSRTRVPQTAVKEKPLSRPRTTKNTTILGDGDTTMLKQDAVLPQFDVEQRQIAYGKFMRAMLEECLVDEKIEREETQMDIQMGLLADRFQKTIDHLDKTNRRLKDINFVTEQKRLIDLKNNHCDDFYNLTKNSNAQELVFNLNAKEQASLDKLHTKNVDFGYTKESGHKQLLDAVNDAIEGLEQIKKHSKLDMSKFKEYERSERSLDDLEKDRFDLDALKADFETKFPEFSERLLKEASERIAKMFGNEEIDDDDD